MKTILILLTVLLYNAGAEAGIFEWRERAKQNMFYWRKEGVNSTYYPLPRLEKKRIIHIEKKQDCTSCPKAVEVITVEPEPPQRNYYDQCVYCPDRVYQEHHDDD